MSYVYDQNRVAAWSQGKISAPDSASWSNLQAGGEIFGGLAILGMDELDEDARQVLATVAGQLSAHLENLRLFDAAQQELVERSKVEETLVIVPLWAEQAMDAYSDRSEETSSM
jgi:GAF domain-containing protein